MITDFEVRFSKVAVCLFANGVTLYVLYVCLGFLLLLLAFFMC